MPVLADAYECDVNRRGGLIFIDAADDLRRIGVAIEKMVFSDTGLLDQMIQKHLAEAARMRDWQADVLIEVKDFYFLPIDAGHFRQRVQKFELRSSRGGNDARLTAIADSATNSLGSVFGGHLA